MNFSIFIFYFFQFESHFFQTGKQANKRSRQTGEADGRAKQTDKRNRRTNETDERTRLINERGWQSIEQAEERDEIKNE